MQRFPATPTRRPPGEGEGLKQEFSLWAIFALAFAFISPIVALYGIFAFSFVSAGPAMWWGFFVVLGGQLLVASVFAELASRWPSRAASTSGRAACSTRHTDGSPAGPTCGR